MFRISQWNKNAGKLEKTGIALVAVSVLLVLLIFYWQVPHILDTDSQI